MNGKLPEMGSHRMVCAGKRDLILSVCWVSFIRMVLLVI